MILNEFTKLCDLLFILKNSGSLEIRIIDFQIHFVLSYIANAGTVIDLLLII